MKKICTIIAALAMTLAATAQVALWNTRIYNHWNEQTQRYEEKKDTAVSVDCLLNYNDLDSFRFVKDYRYGDELMLNAYTKYSSASFHLNYQYNYETEEYGNYDYQYTLDSIVWQPYKVKDIASFTWLYNNREWKDTIIIPLRTIQTREVPNGEYSIWSTAIQPEPRYAAANDLSFSVENSAICDIQDVNYRYSTFGMEDYYGVNFYLYPYEEGKTKLNVTMNGVEKQFTIVVAPKEEIEDADYGLDSLFNKIYNRMTDTGDCKPAGCSDIPNADEGATSFIRSLSYLNDMSADQVYWVWGDAGIDVIRNNSWTADNDILDGLFRRLYYNIYLCNSFLSQAPQSDAVRIAEVRFIRAYMYYQLMDLFGNVPIVIDNTEFFSEPQATRAQLYDFVVEELLAAEQQMLAKKSDAYRVDKVAAWLLLSRVYLNSEVYAGKQDLSKAAEYAYKVLQSDYSLCSNYKYLFMGDNDTNGAQDESVWALRQVGSEHSSYNASQYLVASYADGNTDVGVSPWTCANTRSQLPALFTDDENDVRNAFTDSYTWHENPNGKTILKWTGLYSNGQGGTDANFPDTDIPLFRLAEAYLNYAEAVLRGGSAQGDLTALQAVNAIRQRAGATEFAELELQTILDERGREFYAESIRRSDLVRFDMYGGDAYFWDYKGKQFIPPTTFKGFPEYMNIYPIPQTIMERNPKLVQNEGY